MDDLTLYSRPCGSRLILGAIIGAIDEDRAFEPGS